MSSFLKITLIFTISTFLIFPFHIFNSMVVKAWAEEPGPLIINFKPITRAERGKAIEIVAEIESGNVVMTPELYYRKQGETRYNKIRMERDKDRFTAVIPQSAADGEGIEYYIIAEDSSNNQVSEGSPERPYFIAIAGEADEEPPKIKFTPVREAGKVNDIVLKANVEDKSGIKDVQLYYRQKDKPSYNIIRMENSGKLDGDYQAVIPSKENNAGDIEYYIEATDTSENTGTKGTADYPLIINVVSGGDSGDSIFKKWWFYTILVAVGGGAAAALSSGGGGSQGSQTKGSVVVE
ncbi:MAG TPA: hypothetical protein DDX84_04070 [Nitrospiraceae bacterium]|nr:MAG: hypothetical protein A3D21_05965 [Nitrospirae bacterium RIFCSPHIGHO2_02_FULL_42_12]HBI23382.1 hypothetical protein [Nitrospiraceae bacterium]